MSPLRKRRYPPPAVVERGGPDLRDGELGARSGPLLCQGSRADALLGGVELDKLTPF